MMMTIIIIMMMLVGDDDDCYYYLFIIIIITILPQWWKHMWFLNGAKSAFKPRFLAVPGRRDEMEQGTVNYNDLTSWPHNLMVSKG